MSANPNSEVSSQLDETEITFGLLGWAIDWADAEGIRLVNKKLKIAIVLSETEVNISRAFDHKEGVK